MNANKLLSVLRDIRLLKYVSEDELQKLASDYPYFQQAHILLAKKYLLDNNPHFEEKLHLAAIYASDRTNLRAIMLGDMEKQVLAAIIQQRESVAVETQPVKEYFIVNEDELIHSSMSDVLPPQDNVLEEENYEMVADGNTITESTAIEELETAISSDAVKEEELSVASMSDTLPQDNLSEETTNEIVSEENTFAEAIEELETSATSEVVKEDELSHASMSDMLPPQDSELEEENYDAMTEENSSTEAEALEELEVAALPSEAAQEEELSHASISDALPPQDTMIEEENYELVDDTSTTEVAAMEELEAAIAEPAHTNGTTRTEAFNVNQPHTFTDWLNYIQNSPRAILHKSSAPDYQPISVPEPQDVLVSEPKQENQIEELAFVEHNPDILVAEPVDNLQAIDEFVAETTHTGELVKIIPVKELADKSVTENDDLLTETLARIYEEQQLYSKAIRIYAKLSLKFPEKSLYFASLIKDLKSKT